MSFVLIPGCDLYDSEYQLFLNGQRQQFSIQVSSGRFFVNEYGKNRTGMWVRTVATFDSLKKAKAFCLNVARQ